MNKLTESQIVSPEERNKGRFVKGHKGHWRGKKLSDEKN